MKQNQDTNGGRIPLFLIAGFLGSGKTTLLQNLLALYRDKKAGVIINEFGDLGVDSSRIPVRDGIVTTELNGGQIFCSCLSGSFVNSIAAYAGLDVDVLFVEASGLAKPAPLMEIMTYADRESKGAFEYRGMICIIDASRYLILSKTLSAVVEQAAFSDRFLINKTDLASEQEIAEIMADIREIRPGAPVRLTEYGIVDADFLEECRPLPPNGEAESAGKPVEFAGWGPQGRPVPVKLVPAAAVKREGAETFITHFSHICYRIKGYLQSSDAGLLAVDCVGDTVSIALADETAEEARTPGLVMIFPGDSREPDTLLDSWKSSAGIGAFITKQQ
jgi:G3E family GTPase